MEASVTAWLLFRQQNRCAEHLQKNKRNEPSVQEPAVQVRSALQEKPGTAEGDALPAGVAVVQAQEKVFL